MTHTEALRKLLAVGPMHRRDIENCTRWPSQDVGRALNELWDAGEIRKLAAVPVHYALTNTARVRAFAQGTA